MGWAGKIIGGAVGGLVGGPFGVIAGVGLGALFDTLADAAVGGHPAQFGADIAVRPGIVSPSGPGVMIGYRVGPESAFPAGFVVAARLLQSGKYVRAAHGSRADPDGDFVVVSDPARRERVAGDAIASVVFLPYAALPEGLSSVQLELWGLDREGNPYAHARYDLRMPPASTWYTDNLMAGLVSAAVQMVVRDGALDRDEVARIRQVLKQAFELDELGDLALRDTLKVANASALPPGQVLNLLRALDTDAHPMVIGFLYDIAAADGRVVPLEVAFIDELGRALGVSPSVLDAARRRAVGDTGAGWRPYSTPPPGPSSRLDAYYRTLEIEPGASWDEVKAAYRQLARDYHPDRVQNLPQGFRDYATQRMAQVNNAYQALRAALVPRDES